MNPLTLEWAQKAEGDYTAVQCLAQASVLLHDAVCFHAQQCIEKYLKAWLQEANIAFRRTHDLEELLDLILPSMAVWAIWKTDFLVLTTHAVEFRYLADQPRRRMPSMPHKFVLRYARRFEPVLG